EVEWKNTDTVGHTVTSGKPTDNDAGSLFDSSIIKAGGDFKFTFQNPGTFDYFCQVHPWMTGQVIVSTSTSSTTSSSSTMSGNMSMSSGTTSTTPSTTSNQQPAHQVQQPVHQVQQPVHQVQQQNQQSLHLPANQILLHLIHSLV